jgi:RNase P subunit RPR2
VGEFDIDVVAVKDFPYRNIRLKVTCRSCGRERVIEGGMLARSFAPEDRLNQWRVNQFAKRLVCGNCGGRWPVAELGVWP